MAEGFKVIETQEQFDAAIGKRLERERKTIEEKYSDYEELKSKLAEKDNQISDLGNQLAEANSAKDGLNSTISDLQSKVHNYETNSVKMRIAQEFGLDASFADRLSGEDEDSIREDAQKLKNIVGSIRMKTIPLKSTEPEGNDNEAYKNMLKGLKGEE